MRKVGGSSWGFYADPISIALGAAWTAAAGLFPSSITLATIAEMDVIEDTTGEIQQTVVGTVEGATGSADNFLAPPATALCVAFQTPGVVAGKHVRGRSFLSPLYFSLMSADGTPSDIALGLAEGWGDDIKDLASGLVKTVVWSRPKKSLVEPGEYLRFGSNHDITSVSVADKFAVLRSRRD
jgi:hypothetical protein